MRRLSCGDELLSSDFRRSLSHQGVGFLEGPARALLNCVMENRLPRTPALLRELVPAPGSTASRGALGLPPAAAAGAEAAEAAEAAAVARGAPSSKRPSLSILARVRVS